MERWVLNDEIGMLSTLRNIPEHNIGIVGEQLHHYLTLDIDAQKSVDHMVVRMFKEYINSMFLFPYDSTSEVSAIKGTDWYVYSDAILDSMPDLLSWYRKLDESSYYNLKGVKTKLINLTKNPFLCCDKLYKENLKGCIISLLRSLEHDDKHPYTLQNDYSKIVSCSSFRRLQDKAQVFPLELHDYARTRLTHSIEVASVAREISNILCLSIPDLKSKSSSAFEKIVECSAIIHDMGNPPFGHYGESAIRRYYFDNWNLLEYCTEEKELFSGEPKVEKISTIFPADVSDQMYCDFIAFDGNAQALRVMSKLQQYKYGVPIEISSSILGGIIKYPFSSERGIKKGKFGYFYSETDIIKRLTTFGVYRDGYRNPISMILEAADDISYITSDFDDAVKHRIITADIFEREMEKYEKSRATIGTVTIQFFRDFKYYYSRNIERDINEPFIYTMRLLIGNFKKKLISVATNAFINQYVGIMEGIEFSGFEKYIDKGKLELLKFDKEYSELISWINELFSKYLYVNPKILEEELKGEKIIQTLLDEFTKAVLSLDFEINPATNGRYFVHENINLKSRALKVFNLISPNFVCHFYKEYDNAKSEKEKIYYKLKLVVDYVSGMTDSFALECYQKMTGIIQ